MKRNLITHLVGTIAAAVGALSVASGAQAASMSTIQLDTPTWEKFNEQYVQEERKFFENADSKKVDLSRLRLQEGKTGFEVYFINEGAGFRNRLAFAAGNGPQTTLFGDVSATDSVKGESDGPLKLGEGRRVTGLDPASFLSFFVDSNRRGVKDGVDYVFGMDEASNSDGLQHFVGFEDGDYLILGIEDIFGDGKTVLSSWGAENTWADRDFNDIVIAVKGVTTREVSAQATPEPGILLGLIGTTVVVAVRNRRQKAS